MPNKFIAVLGLMSGFVVRVFNAPLFLWALLSIPALPMLGDRYYPELMWESGVIAVQLTAFTLAMTPLLYLCRRWPRGLAIVRWFIKRRRYIGVAAFGYSALHTYFYVRQTESWEVVWLELEEIELLVGWIAMLIMVVLAITSNGFSQRLLGQYWKKVQRLSYLAGLTMAIHWILIDQFIDSLLLLAVPLIVLQLIRVCLARLNFLGARQTSK